MWFHMHVHTLYRHIHAVILHTHTHTHRNWAYLSATSSWRSTLMRCSTWTSGVSDIEGHCLCSMTSWSSVNSDDTSSTTASSSFPYCMSCLSNLRQNVSLHFCAVLDNLLVWSRLCLPHVYLFLSALHRLHSLSIVAFSFQCFKFTHVKA